jgi:transcriptional regulator with XRE-family HTH domain
MKSDAEHVHAFAAWIEGVTRAHGYDIDGPRGGGRTRLAEDAGVHRSAITRLLQRRSMPDLETMRGLSRALGLPVRDLLIRTRYPGAPAGGLRPDHRRVQTRLGPRLHRPGRGPGHGHRPGRAERRPLTC